MSSGTDSVSMVSVHSGDDGVLPEAASSAVSGGRKYSIDKGAAGKKSAQDTSQQVENVVSGNYLVEKLIGSGTFGFVFQGKRLDSSGPRGDVAIKVAISGVDSTGKINKKKLAFNNRNLQREVKYLNILCDGSKESAFFISFFETYIDPQVGEYCIVMPMMESDLHTAILNTPRRAPYPWEARRYPFLDRCRKLREGFSLGKTKKFAEQLLGAAKHMQRKNVVHTDIKPQNILLPSKDGDEIKLADLNAAEHPFTSSKERQPLYYRSPECTIGHDANFPIDLWSIGCALIEIFTGAVLNQSVCSSETNSNSLNAQHLINIAAFVGHHHSVTHLASRVKLFLYEYKDDPKKPNYDDAQWQIKAGEVAQYFARSKRTWEEVLSPELLQFKQSKCLHPGEAAALAEDFERFKHFMRRILDPNPDTRYTAEQALQEDPWICYDAAAKT